MNNQFKIIVSNTDCMYCEKENNELVCYNPDNESKDLICDPYCCPIKKEEMIDDKR